MSIGEQRHVTVIKGDIPFTVTVQKLTVHGKNKSSVTVSDGLFGSAGARCSITRKGTVVLYLSLYKCKLRVTGIIRTVVLTGIFPPAHC